MSRNVPRRSARPVVESLEDRALLSAAMAHGHHTDVHAEVRHAARRDLTFGGPGAGAILSALNGGAGHEFVTLINKEVKNINSVILKFATGAITQYTVAGFVAKIPNAQPLYTGGEFDRMFLTVGGAVLLKGNTLELAAITRGPFSESDATSQVVFAINRGSGASIGPAFASRPNITPDELVTITVGPYASSVSGTITDLDTGAVLSISSSAIQVAGPVVRVLVNSRQMPSEGQPFKRYTFAAWTNLSPGAGIASVGSFIPESSMIPVGVLSNVKPPRL